MSSTAFGAFANDDDKTPFATTEAATIVQAAKNLDRLVWALGIEDPIIRPISPQNLDAGTGRYYRFGHQLND